MVYDGTYDYSVIGPYGQTCKWSELKMANETAQLVKELKKIAEELQLIRRILYTEYEKSNSDSKTERD